MGATRQAEHRSNWPWLSLIPIGLGAWAPIYAGIRARRWSWILLGVLCCLVVIAGFVEANAGKHSGSHALAGGLLLFGWVAAIVTSFSIRPAYDRQMSSPLLEASEAARQRLAERRQALELARQDPSLAREMGIGRPDTPGAAAAGLVDVNNASVAALEQLPGVDDQLATRIVETRAQVGGFSSLEDLGAALDLDGDLVEGLREKVVFLPRERPSGR